MKKTFFSSLLLLFILLSFSCQKKEKSLEDTFKKSVEWMWAQQSEDGGWHSKTHAVLRDGKVLTPYILFYLLQVHEDIFQADTKSIDKAIDFIIREMRTAMNKDSTTLVDYPNYSAAYALRILNIARPDTQLQNLLIDYLLLEQFNPNRGFDSTHLVYGGWGYGEPNLKSGNHGHVDISHTRRVTEALCEAGLFLQRDIRSEIKDDVVLFLKGVQRNTNDHRPYEGCISRVELPYDGGFVASVVTVSTIKSQPLMIEGAGHHYPSYATATCDGLLAMRVLGMQSTTAYNDALNWLKQNQRMYTVDGLADNPEQWDDVMHLYHLAVRSEAMFVVDPYGPWKDSIALILKNEQHHEGYYMNPLGGVNKEDDPLMATIFAIQAASNLYNHSSAVSSADFEIINCMKDTMTLDSLLHENDGSNNVIKVVIQSKSADTIYFSGFHQIPHWLKNEYGSIYSLEGMPNTSIADWGPREYILPLIPFSTDTFLAGYPMSIPFSRSDIDLKYLIKDERKTSKAVLYQ